MRAWITELQNQDGLSYCLLLGIVSNVWIYSQLLSCAAYQCLYPEPYTHEIKHVTCMWNLGLKVNYKLFYFFNL